jgi:hypothetical protein
MMWVNLAIVLETRLNTGYWCSDNVVDTCNRVGQFSDSSGDMS